MGQPTQPATRVRAPNLPLWACRTLQLRYTPCVQQKASEHKLLQWSASRLPRHRAGLSHQRRSRCSAETPLALCGPWPSATVPARSALMYKPGQALLGDTHPTCAALTSCFAQGSTAQRPGGPRLRPQSAVSLSHQLPRPRCFTARCGTSAAARSSCAAAVHAVAS